MNKITLFIIDDNIPKPKEFIDNLAFEKAISADQLLKLSRENNWKSEKNLQKIINLLTSHDYANKGLIEIYGFIHPEIALQAIENNLKPDVIIYDWEYGDSFSNNKSGDLLLEILHSTDAFVFVYSGIKGEIPSTLNKTIFDQDAKRFQLFGKGDVESSIYSSEEFIYQYILNRVNKTNSIKIHDKDIVFRPNGYLDSPSDILYLEKIFGRSVLLKKLNGINVISKESIERIFGSVEGKILFDESRNLLISPDESLLIENFAPKEKLSYSEVLTRYGIKNLETVLSVGIVRV